MFLLTENGKTFHVPAALQLDSANVASQDTRQHPLLAKSLLMSNGARERAPTRLTHVESSDEENDSVPLGKTSKPPVPVEKAHSSSRHHVEPILACRPQLLAWYNKVKDRRGMPWRKAYDPDLDADARRQRAYEVLTSEIMLQQTQVLVLEPCLVWSY